MSQSFGFSCDPAIPWKAGTIKHSAVCGDDSPDEDLYYGCADCDARGPAIAGLLSVTPDGKNPAITRRKDGRGYDLALFCGACWEARLKEGKARAE